MKGFATVAVAPIVVALSLSACGGSTHNTTTILSMPSVANPGEAEQRGKSEDASAKELARTAETAAETYSTDHNGSYAGLNATELNAIEPTILTTASATNAYLSGVTEVTVEVYKVTATSTSGDTFSVKRLASGNTARECTGTKGGCVGGTW